MNDAKMVGGSCPNNQMASVAHCKWLFSREFDVYAFSVLCCGKLLMENETTNDNEVFDLIKQD